MDLRSLVDHVHIHALVVHFWFHSNFPSDLQAPFDHLDWAGAECFRVWFMLFIHVYNASLMLLSLPLGSTRRRIFLLSVLWLCRTAEVEIILGRLLCYLSPPWMSMSVQNFGPDWNIGWIVMKLCTNVHVPQKWNISAAFWWIVMKFWCFPSGWF